MVIKEIARIVLKTKKGQTFDINDKHIVSLSTSASCSSGGGIPAGCCNAGTMSLSFKQQGTGIVEADLFQASLTLYVQYPPHAESVRGVYNVTNSNLRYGIFDVSASDNIGMLDDAAYSAKDTENAVCGLLSVIGAGAMRYPAHILSEICNSYGVPHLTQAENAAIIPESTANLLMTSVSSECSTESIKDFANYLSEYIGGFITAYEDGRVGFGRIGKSEYTETLDEKNIQKGSFQKSPFSVWPTIWKVNFDSGYNNYWYTTSDTPDGYAPLSIEINNNPFWQYLEDSMPSGLVGGKTSDMIKYMWDYIVSIRNYINPFSATVYVPHLFKLGEIVHIKKPGDDSATRKFTSCITDVTWTYRGGQQISCAGSDTRFLSCSTSRTSAKKAEDYAKTLYRKKSSGGTGTNDTYTKAEIDSKDAAVKAIADKAQSTAASAATAASNAQSTANSAKSTASSAAAAAADAQNVNKTQDGQIKALQETVDNLHNYEHPAYSAHQLGFYKFANDEKGHVTDAENVTASDLHNAGGVIQSTLNLYDYEGYIPLSFMTLFNGGGLKNIAEILFLNRDSNKQREIRLCLGSRNDMSTGCLNLVDYNGCQYILEPNPDSPGAQYYGFYFPKQSGTLALTKDIPDISGKQDKSTAVTHNANTAVGSATKPVYIDSNGAATPIAHSINSDVPANAKFTDTVYTHPTTAGNKHIPAGGSSGQILRWSADGTAVWGADNNTTYSDATQSVHGLMTAADKKKLDGIAAGATNVAVDDALSATSTNPVQNKVVQAALNVKAASDHTHAMITNSALWVSGANQDAKWVKLGTLVSSGNFSNGVIRVWTGNGANGRANQNAYFEIQIKDGWQSTESATKACGVTVYRINCSGVKAKVIPTAHDTYTVWAYMPWGYWNGNYAVYGKYKSWTSQHLIQSDEPEGTGADTAYYDQAFLTSTVAKSTEANALTETAWTAVPATGAAETVYNSLQYLKSGNMVFVQGAIGFKAGLNTPTCGTMPSGLLPGIELCFTGWDYVSGVPAAYPIKLAKNGVISLLSPTSTAYWFKAGRIYHFNFSYHIG